MIYVDIVSDTICPWCYIGKRRFERALDLSGRNDVALSWRPFQLAFILLSIPSLADPTHKDRTKPLDASLTLT